MAQRSRLDRIFRRRRDSPISRPSSRPKPPPEDALEQSWRHITLNIPSTVKQALADGLNPNILWDEEDLVIPRPKGGCMLPVGTRESETWPHWNTPLHCAMRFSAFDSAEVLLQHGADINLYNSIGRTPLHEAIMNRKYDNIRFLLAHGADVNNITVEAYIRFKDEDMDIYGRGGDVSLLIALDISDSTSLSLLVEAGAGLATDSEPWTIFDLALLARDRRAIKVLLNQGLKPLIQPSFLERYQPGTDYSGLSKDLLALARGNKIVPPSELYETYCHALWKADIEEKLKCVNRDIDIESLIRSLFEALQDAAGPEQQTKKMMCASCQQFQSEAFYTTEEGKSLQFLLHHDRQHLNDSAGKGCPLCGITADALDQPGGGSQNDDIQSVDLFCPVFIRGNLDRITGTDSSKIRSFSVRCGQLYIEMHLTTLHDDFIPSYIGQDKQDVHNGWADSIEAAKSWLQACQKGDAHSVCRKSYCSQQQKGSWPRRLLYVGDKGKQSSLVFLQDKQPPYLALSYCWGTTNFLITTQENLQQHIKGIRLERLPAVMLDAVSVTQALGYSYIWIDALCIIQNDVEDWDHEAANMHAIYSNAELTISSLVASDCHTGLFTPRIQRVTHPVPFDIWQPKMYRQSNESLAVYPQWTSKDQTVLGPVHSRGWTLQEQLLSTRILWFGHRMVHWECLHCYVFEANPTHGMALSFGQCAGGVSGRITAKRAIKATLSEDQKTTRISDKRSQPFEIWKRELEEFTKRNLTKLSDRLPAIISVSSSLANNAGSEFLCGIWSGDKLLESLCWRAVKPLPKNTSINMPSWSWASVDGEISFDMVSWSGRGGIEILPGSSVVSVDIEPNKSLGHIPRSITFRAALHQKKPFDVLYAANSKKVKPLFLQHCQSGMVYLDHMCDFLENCYAIDVLSFPHGPLYEGYGYPAWPIGRPAETIKLFLQPINEDLNVFQRVGVGIVPGMPTDGCCYKLDLEEGLASWEWLTIDEKILEVREITII
jgi:hypothetical protein